MAKPRVHYQVELTIMGGVVFCALCGVEGPCWVDPSPKAVTCRRCKAKLAKRTQHVVEGEKK